MHTFVIPAYKESFYLENCIQSLLAQSVKSEIIITTSTPSNFIAKIAEKYSLPYHINHNPGIANDWNFALSKAHTPYATIAHQDDIYEPAYTENILKSVNCKSSESPLILFTGYYDLVNSKTRQVSLNSVVKKTLLFPFAFKSYISSQFAKKLLLSFGDPVCCPTVAFNLQALKDFSFSTEYTCVLDWYAWYQLAKQPGIFCFINKKLVGHRIHLESETSAQIALGKRRSEERQMFQMIWGNRMAKIFSWIYSLGHADNKIKADI
jgi:glycosyltransferase involved in cell wall biosynthesis